MNSPKMVATRKEFFDMISYQISPKLAMTLSTLVTKLKLQQALLDLSNDKARGLDGVLMEFFKIYWGMISGHQNLVDWGLGKPCSLDF